MKLLSLFKPAKTEAKIPDNLPAGSFTVSRAGEITDYCSKMKPGIIPGSQEAG